MFLSIIIAAIKKSSNALLKSERGVFAIQVALAAPVFLMLVLGVIEFGWHFIRSEITANATDNVAQTLKQDPNHTFTTAEMNSYGSGLINFNSPGNGNYICVYTWPVGQTMPASTCGQPTTTSALTPAQLAADQNQINNLQNDEYVTQPGIINNANAAIANYNSNIASYQSQIATVQSNDPGCAGSGWQNNVSCCNWTTQCITSNANTISSAYNQINADNSQISAEQNAINAAHTQENVDAGQKAALQSAMAQTVPVPAESNFQSPDTIPAGQPYNIYVTAVAKGVVITPLSQIIPAIANIQTISQSLGVITVSNPVIPVCANGVLKSNNGLTCVPVPTCGNNQKLTYSGGVFACVNIQSTVCNNPWQHWNAQTNVCDNVPYIIAAGMANPQNVPPGGVQAGDDGFNGTYWAEDIPSLSMQGHYYPEAPGACPGQNGGIGCPGTGGWMPDNNFTIFHVNDFTLCEYPITFAIPAGLPAGQLVPSGNLMYSNGGSPAWHHWAISFSMATNYSGTSGQLGVCESNGGNWNNNTTGMLINAEHISWIVTWIPTTAPMTESYFKGNAGTIGTFSR